MKFAKFLRTAFLENTFGGCLLTNFYLIGTFTISGLRETYPSTLYVQSFENNKLTYLIVHRMCSKYSVFIVNFEYVKKIFSFSLFL